MIFNTYTNTASVTVYVLKVLMDNRNSRLVRWEDALSGGEGLITNFIAYTALSEYTRMRRANTDSRIKQEQIRSVFIFDNPFGEASSDHLVKALRAISEKFGMQLICFSDLKQASIVNNFDLIYQLSMRQALYSRISRLEIDKVIDKAACTNCTDCFWLLHRLFLFFALST